VLDGDCLGSLKELMQHSAVFGLEPAALGRSEALLGEAKLRDGFQCLANAAELLLDAGAERSEWRCATPRGAYDLERLGEKTPALRFAFRDAVGTHQSQRFPALQSVLFDRLADCLLRLGLERAQSMCERHPERAGIDSLYDLRSKLLGERQASHHPRPLLATHPRDGRRSQAFVVP